jgi:hypothetical protein
LFSLKSKNLKRNSLIIMANQKKHDDKYS